MMLATCGAARPQNITQRVAYYTHTTSQAPYYTHTTSQAPYYMHTTSQVPSPPIRDMAAMDDTHTRSIVRLHAPNYQCQIVRTKRGVVREQSALPPKKRFCRPGKTTRAAPLQQLLDDHNLPMRIDGKVVPVHYNMHLADFRPGDPMWEHPFVNLLNHVLCINGWVTGEDYGGSYNPEKLTMERIGKELYTRERDVRARWKSHVSGIVSNAVDLLQIQSLEVPTHQEVEACKTAEADNDDMESIQLQDILDFIDDQHAALVMEAPEVAQMPVTDASLRCDEVLVWECSTADAFTLDA